MGRSFTATLALVASLGFAAPTAAQQAEWTQGDEDRSTILEFLEREDAGSAAAGLGVDLQELGRGVLDMSDDDAARVADDVRSLEQALAADTITFTTTTLIIILLVVIVLILALD